MVYAALAALVSFGDGVWDARSGTCAGVDDVLAAAVPHRVLLHRDPMADRDHFFGKLYIPELFGIGARIPFAR